MTRRRRHDHARAEARRLKPGVLARYWLVQLPGTLLVALVLLVLARAFDWSAWLVAGGLAAWVGKDALLYPLLWRSYDAGYPSLHTLDGAHGVAVERIEPAGYARVRGELWRVELAAGAAPIEAGETIVVEATRELTLLVRADGA